MSGGELRTVAGGNRPAHSTETSGIWLHYRVHTVYSLVGMDPQKSTGRYNAAEARGNAEVVQRIAEITGLPTSEVDDTLNSAHGVTHVRNLFRDHWPWSAQKLGVYNVTFARDHGLHEEIMRVTSGTAHLVSKRLNASHGRQLLRNLFWDYWPAEEPPPPPDVVEDTVLEEGPSDTVPAPPDDLESVTVGTRLSGRYELRRQLGVGGFGTTWDAHDHLADLELVVKIPHAEDGGAIKNELRQAFRTFHPNICQAFPEKDDDTGRPFLVMQHGGEDLLTRMQSAGDRPLPLTLAVHVLVSIADALDYLHVHNVLHLDVTPKNILIDEDDVVRLTDFGASSLARVHTTADGHRTRLATDLHSFSHAYAAPELFDGVARGRSDQYSLFLVFCSLLHGHALKAPNFVFSDIPTLSNGQNEIVRRALARDPEKRFESCAEPARALADGLTAVSSPVLVGDVERLCRDFILRVEREHTRHGGNTARLGGALKLGRGLERILQATLLWMASDRGFDPLEALRGIDKHATSIDRTTAGNLSKTIAGQGTGWSPVSGYVSALLEDLTDKRGRIFGLINARNDVVHGRREAEALIPYATSVADLFRSAASV